MTVHDALCPSADMAAVQYQMRCYCHIIARARADERARWQPRIPVASGHASFCWCSACGTGERP